MSRWKTNKNKRSLIIIREKLQRIQITIQQKSVEKILIQRAVKTTTQKLYDNGLFDNFPKVDTVNFLFVTRRRVGLETVNDDEVQWFCSKILFKK